MAMIASSLQPGERIEVYISACDPVSREGIVSQLRGHGMSLVDERNLHSNVVGLVVVDDVDEQTTQQIRALKHGGLDKVVVMATRVEDGGLLAAVEAGANGFLRRSQSTAIKLVETIRTAATGDGVLPPDLLARLMGQVGRLHRQGLNPRGLRLPRATEREGEVPKVPVQGLGTHEGGHQVVLA